MVMPTSVDLNADLAEGWGAQRVGDDAGLLALVSSANLACGFHGGDPLVLRQTLAECARRGVQPGAHPSWLDPWGFGRRVQSHWSADEVEALLLYQVGAVRTMAEAAGLQLGYVKLHGALHNQASHDPTLAEAVGRVLLWLGSAQPLAWLVMPHTAQHRAGSALGVPLRFEYYVDRGYDAQGQLVPRGQPGALLDDPLAAALRAVEAVRRQALPLAGGGWLPAPIDSLCVHGDTPHAVAMARAVREALLAAGVQIAAPWR